MAPKIVDKDEKRQSIALAAVEVFGLKGFERTRMDDVAKEAGVGKGTIYEYFENKEQLMRGAMGVLMAEFASELVPASDPGKGALQTLEDISASMVAMMEELGDKYRFFLEYTLHLSRVGDSFGNIPELLTAFRAGLAAVIEAGQKAGEIRGDVDPFETAAAIAAWYDGAIFHWIALPDTVSLETMGKRFLEFAMDGLVPRGAADNGGER